MRGYTRRHSFLAIGNSAIGRHGQRRVRASRKSQRMSLKASTTMTGSFQEPSDIGVSVGTAIIGSFVFSAGHALDEILPRHALPG